MAVVKFTFDPTLTEWFVRFGYLHYSGDSRWIPPLKKELHTQLAPTFPFYRQPGNAHQHFLAVSGRKIVGRVSAMVNRDLQNNGGTPVGTLGFFECVHDYAVARELLDTATAWLREQHQIQRIWGPMNFDIWHSYRFMTKGFDQDLFCGEPYNKPYYPEFFERYGFKAWHRWDSLEVNGRQTLKQMIVRGAKRYKLLTDRGYRFEPFDSKRADGQVRKLYQIMTKSFAGFPGYTPLSLDEFERLFEHNRVAFHPRLSLMAYDENNVLAGFAAVLIELSDAVRPMKGEDNLLARLKFMYRRRNVRRINFYLGGVTPEEIQKRSGLGRAGFYYVINQVLNEGYETLLLTLRLKGNHSRALPGNTTAPQREYALYETNL